MTRTRSTVAVLGVRHHGPGSARSVASALAELQPELVLIEGAPELDTVAALAGAADMVPPVAGLVYAVDQPRLAAFYPLAAFSPEWVALRWALRHGVDVGFADLPAAHQLADLAASTDPEADPEADPDTGHARRRPGQTARPDPIGSLAAAAGYDDPERWWEDAIEHRGSSTLSRFAAVRDAMAAVRAGDHRPADDPDVVENARREAAMRKAVRAAQTRGVERIAFVCGAYHAPALDPATFPPAAQDNRLLVRLPRVKVAATWAPWTAGRLAMASGYGAGITSPGWYAHLFEHWASPEPGPDVASGWLVRVARAIRDQRLDASTASVVEASRLADALAAIRGRPSVGLAELDDAAEAVLCEGSPVPMRLVHDTLVVGRELGQVPQDAPAVPLAADLARSQRSLRLTPSPVPSTVTLDLRRDSQLARSVLLHRLRLLAIPWGTESDAGVSTGTFKEVWDLDWQPEYSVAVIEAGLYGTTVAAAADAKVAEAAAAAPDLAALSELIGDCLVARLPDGMAAAVRVLEERTAHQHDVESLLAAVEPLARTCRYGDVRGVDTAAVARIVAAMVRRASVGLPAACANLDDDAAGALRSAVDAGQRGVALVDDATLREPWQAALTAVAGSDRVHGTLLGRANRLLLDAGRIDTAEAARRMSRRLSPGAPAPAAAAWLEAFLSGEAVLLVHDPVLLAVVDEWVSRIGAETFDDLLPLLRRTFAQFSPAERRLIGERLRPGADPAGGSVASSARDEPDLDRAAAAVARVARLLGLRPLDPGGAW